jgi:hypothetical protein
MDAILRAGLIVDLCVSTAYSTLLYVKNCTHCDVPVKVMCVHSPSTAQGEQFDRFFKRFNSYADFQLARISFPLKTITIDDDNKRLVKYINKREWKYPNVAKVKDILITTYKVAKGEVTILLQIQDTGVHTKYNFINKEGNGICPLSQMSLRRPIIYPCYLLKDE